MKLSQSQREVLQQVTDDLLNSGLTPQILLAYDVASDIKNSADTDLMECLEDDGPAFHEHAQFHVGLVRKVYDQL